MTGRSVDFTSCSAIRCSAFVQIRKLSPADTLALESRKLRCRSPPHSNGFLCLTCGVLAHATRPAHHLLVAQDVDEPAVEHGGAHDDAARRQVHPGGQRRRRHDDAQGALAERALDDVALVQGHPWEQYEVSVHAPYPVERKDTNTSENFIIKRILTTKQKWFILQ